MAERCPTCNQLLPGARAPLTVQQAAIMRFLKESIAANGYAPKFEDIAEAFGYNSLSTVHEHLLNLERKGYIRRAFNETRSILLVD